jgi:type IV fimbrial biogenesis protein FimT
MTTALSNKDLKQNNLSPFICQKKPFICVERSYTYPFIGNKKPFVVLPENNRGFTLIELMVGLVVLAVLMGIAAPAMTSFVANQRLSGQSNDLMSDLTFARSEAIRRGAAVTVCKTADPSVAAPACNVTVADAWTAGRIVFADPNGNGTRDAGEQVLKIRQALEGADTTGNMLLGDGIAAGTANRIIFGGNGATGSNGTNALTPAAGNSENQWFLCDSRGDAEARTIAIHPMGRARVIPARGQDMENTAIASCP